MNLTIIIPSKKEPNIVEMMEALEIEFPDAQIIVCNDRYGKGKGWAVREALEEAEGDIVGFIDGDMDIHPRMFWRLLPFLEDYDVIVGSKLIRGSICRRWLTRLSRIYLHAFFGFNFDTQTGIKLFNRFALPPYKTNGFLFDIEILRNARLLGLGIISVPVEVTFNSRDKRPMKIINIWNTFLESLKLLIR